MDQITRFYEEIGHQIKQFPGGIDALAEASGISKVTLWRWINGINLKYPDQHRVLQVLMAISNKKSLHELKTFFGPSLNLFLDTIYPPKNLTIGEQKELNIFEDYYYFLIYILAGNESGVSLEELFDTCGNIAAKKAGIDNLSIDSLNELGKFVLPKINELEQLEIIAKRENRYFRTQKSALIPLDDKRVIKFYSENVDNFLNPSDSHLGYNAFYTVFESIEPSLAKELALDTQNFFLECYKKIEQGKCKNGVPYQMMFLSEKLTFNNDLLSQGGK